MCGIFGFSLSNDKYTAEGLHSDCSLLYRLSEVRGVEAAGMAVQNGGATSVYKKSMPAYRMSQHEEFKDFFFDTLPKGPGGVNLVAHSRLVTNGVQADNKNNQPAYSSRLACVHNGIVTNPDGILEEHNDLIIDSQLDTEIFIKLIDKYYTSGGNLVEAVRKAYKDIEGYANIGLLDDSGNLLLATNNGSIYYAEHDGSLVFASEKYIMEQYIKEARLGLFAMEDIRHLESYTGLMVTKEKVVSFGLRDEKYCEVNVNKNEHFYIDDFEKRIEVSRKKLRRCTKCILPETMPFIKFDDQGVCNYCHNYTVKDRLGKDKLLERVEALRKADGSPELVFAFSGGRDSCYALHYAVKELGLRPVAYSYDWGMITDLGRRNQARLLGQLGIEHVIISADIRKKRNNIHKNVNAWLKKPDLGMIPLIIAGDKQMFYYAQQVQEHYGANGFMFSTNYLEKTDFKTGFANVNTVDLKGLSMALTDRNKYAMVWHYLKNFASNPAYINSSLFDTMDAFFKYYNKKHNVRLEFYDYIIWDEDTVNSTLLDQYNWETSPDTPTTWRIGDGTAAFYNYIYHTVAGFTENDTFRSNQIREGVLTREKALELVEKENVPRWPTIKEYCELIQVDFVRAVEIIDSIPKHYM